MSVFRRIAYLLFASGMLLPTTLAAQGGGGRGGGTRPKPGVPQTAQQTSGEALFYQNCTLCHVYSTQKRTVGIQAPSELIGLFKNGAVEEADVRQRIEQGVPGRMPSFRYNFEPREFDDVMAYLKIR